MEKNNIQPAIAPTEAQPAKTQWTKPVLRKLDLNEALASGSHAHNDGSFPFS